MTCRLLKLKRFFENVNCVFSSFGFKFSVIVKLFYPSESERAKSEGLDLEQNLSMDHADDDLEESFLKIDSGLMDTNSFQFETNSHPNRQTCNLKISKILRRQDTIPNDKKFKEIEISLFKFFELKQSKLAGLLSDVFYLNTSELKTIFFFKIKRVQRKDQISYILGNSMNLFNSIRKKSQLSDISDISEVDSLYQRSTKQESLKTILLKTRENLIKWRQIKQLLEVLRRHRQKKPFKFLIKMKKKVDLFLWKYLVFHDNSNYFKINKFLVFALIIVYTFLIDKFWTPFSEKLVISVFDYCIFPLNDIFLIIMYFAFLFSNKIKIERIFLYSSFLTLIKGLIMVSLLIISDGYSRFFIFCLVQILINILITYIQCFNYSFHYFKKYENQLRQIN